LEQTKGKNMVLKNVVRSLTAVLALSFLTGVVSAPVLADSKKKVTADHCADCKDKSKCDSCQKKSGKSSKTKTASAKKFECQHCKVPMSVADAKKQGMKCCGMKMVEVKTAKKEGKKKG
jgi:hypothetical protein